MIIVHDLSALRRSPCLSIRPIARHPSHGFVTHLSGDDTAWRLGRISFDPLVHIDPLPYGLLILIGLLFILPLLGSQLGIYLDPLSRLIMRSTNAVVGIILRLAGNI